MMVCREGKTNKLIPVERHCPAGGLTWRDFPMTNGWLYREGPHGSGSPPKAEAHGKAARLISCLVALEEPRALCQGLPGCTCRGGHVVRPVCGQVGHRHVDSRILELPSSPHSLICVLLLTGFLGTNVTSPQAARDEVLELPRWGGQTLMGQKRNRYLYLHSAGAGDSAACDRESGFSTRWVIHGT